MNLQYSPIYCLNESSDFFSNLSVLRMWYRMSWWFLAAYDWSYVQPAVIYRPLATILYTYEDTRYTFSVSSVQKRRTEATETHETLPRASRFFHRCLASSSRHTRSFSLFHGSITRGKRGAADAARNSCDTRVTWRTCKCNENSKKQKVAERIPPLRRKSNS